MPRFQTQNPSATKEPQNKTLKTKDTQNITVWYRIFKILSDMKRMIKSNAMDARSGDSLSRFNNAKACFWKILDASMAV